jgi:transposase-like protein
MLKTFAEALMSAEASMLAPPPTASAPRGGPTRNGYRARPWDTRAGTIEDLAVPKLRRGVYSPEFLLQPRRRAEQALVAVICQAYVGGVPPAGSTTW